MSIPLSTRLRELREQAGLSPVALCARANVAPAILSRIESGHRLPSWETLLRIAVGLGVSLAVFDVCVERE